MIGPSGDPIRVIDAAWAVSSRGTTEIIDANTGAEIEVNGTVIVEENHP